MKQVIFYCALTLSFISISQTKAQVLWTEADQEEYARKKADSTCWDMKRLQSDLEFAIEYMDDSNPAISDYPSPVPKYDWGYGFIANINIEINGKMIKGISIGYADDKYRSPQESDTPDSYINYFNLFIATDLPEDTTSASAIISRNYPHYLSTGQKPTSLGKVDWMQMSLADGDNFAVISQRYFNLKQGRTVLVAPFKDGTLRLLQIRDSHGSSKIPMHAADGLKKFNADLIKRIMDNEEVVRFFSQKGILCVD